MFNKLLLLVLFASMVTMCSCTLPGTANGLSPTRQMSFQAQRPHAQRCGNALSLWELPYGIGIA